MSSFFEKAIDGDVHAILIIAIVYFVIVGILSLVLSLRIRPWPMTRGMLVVGYVDGALHAGLLSLALKALKSKYSAIKLQLLPMRSSIQFQKLNSGGIDVALTYSAPLRSDALVPHHTDTEVHLLAVPSSNGWSNPIRTNQLDDQPFIWPPTAALPAAREKMVEACAEAGFYPDIPLEATSPLAVLELVGAEAGIALVQSSLQQVLPRGVSFFAMPKMFRERIELLAVHRDKTTSTEDIFLKNLSAQKLDESCR